VDYYADDGLSSAEVIMHHIHITYLLTYLFTYLLTSWCRIVFAKLTVTQLVKQHPAFFMEPEGSTVFTKARHWTLS
jgi:hypothetical protein